MDTQSLETFIKTAELLHFGKASRACNLSPSALTRTIQRMEEELGQPLFLRDNRTVELTEAGRQFLDYARHTLQEWQHLRESIVPGATVSGPLSLYASITAVYSLLPRLLETYRQTYPDVQLELRTGAAENALEQLLGGEIDLAVAALPDHKPDRFEFLPLAETPLVFITQKRPGRKREELDLSTVPLVLPQAGLARDRLDTWLRKHGITPNISSEVSGNEALIAMVRLGAGVGIVPELTLERSPFRDEIQAMESAPQLAPYQVGLCAGKRSLKRPAVNAMWALAETL